MSKLRPIENQDCNSMAEQELSLHEVLAHIESAKKRWCTRLILNHSLGACYLVVDIVIFKVGFPQRVNN